ncbi:MAG: zinc ABC transporter substrate-binding protein, partial [Pseudomonadota bacterium]
MKTTIRQNFIACTVLGFSAPFTAHAATPNVAVDIAPLHSLVSQVMQGVGDPALLIPAEASPHEYALRPSDAKALASADIVFWMGEELTPWLEKAIENVAESSEKIAMLDLDGTVTHEFREGATFEGHDHDDHDEDHDDHGHDEDHDDHGHDEDHDDHGHDEDHDDHGHDEDHDDHGHDEDHDDHGHDEDHDD